MAINSQWNRETYNPRGGNILSHGIRIRVSGPLFRQGAVQAGIDAATRETLDYGKGIIGDRTPVRTGVLKEGWEVIESQRMIANPIKYSIFVEAGTSRMEGRGMAERSLPEIQDYYSESISRHIMAEIT